MMKSFAVLFDIDGLMLDSERMAINAWKVALAERGYIMDDDLAHAIIGLTVEDTARMLEGVYGVGWPYSEVYARRLAMYEAEIDTNGIPVKPGLMEVLEFTAARQIPRAIASSTPCWFASRKLGRSGLDVHFQVVVCGDMVANGKPAPDLFLEAARRIGMPPERCVVLEDSEAGVMAARAAGMVPLMVPDLKQPSLEIRALAYQVLPSLYEAIPVLEGFLENGLPGGPATAV